MLEFVLPEGAITLADVDLRGYAPIRQTGWRFTVEEGAPRVCTAYETHAQKGAEHSIVNKGDPHPRLESFQDVTGLLIELGLIASKGNHDNRPCV